MEVLTIFLPGLAALIVGLLGRAMGTRASQAITCGAMIVATGLAIALFVSHAGARDAEVIRLGTWITSGSLEVFWALRFDTLTAVMVLLVTLVSCLVHFYALGDMSHDPAKPRFMAYLSLLTFAMLMLVTADNLLQLIFGWQAVGVAAYLLIGFWHQKDGANGAASLGFVVNRIGDLALLLGTFVIFALFETVQFAEILDPLVIGDRAALRVDFLGLAVHGLTLAGILFVIGAMAKSAQLGLHIWLADSTYAPTPVSALVQSVTVVAAGVFIIARLSPVFEFAPTALAVMTIVGLLSAFAGATIALTQFDLKRVLAFATMSQMGLIFVAFGTGAYAAALFHLVTVGFAMALLDLAIGSVVQAMSGEQDMAKMGAIWRKVPATYAMTWIGILALSGIPVLSGFFSQGTILQAAWASGSGLGLGAFAIGLIVALITPLYAGRMLFKAFHGFPRASQDVMSHVHESSASVIVPMVIVGMGATAFGLAGYHWFVGDWRFGFWGMSIAFAEAGDVLDAAKAAPLWVKYAPAGAASAGLLMAYLIYGRSSDLPRKITNAISPIHRFVADQYLIAALYDRVIIKPIQVFGERVIDQPSDGSTPNNFGSISKRLSLRLSRLQTGFVYHYAFAMLIGVISLVAWYLGQHSG